MKNLLFVFTLIFVVAAEQSIKDKDLASSLQSIQNVVPGLPSVMEGLPSMDEGEEIVKEKCLKNGNNESYARAMEAKEEFQMCVKSLVNFEVIEEEIEKAKPVGDLDSVFRKYCKKTPLLKLCIANFTAAVAPCLDPNEASGKDIAINLTDSLIKFICHKEGDRIALFIAEGGPECLKSQVNAVQGCLNDTFSGVDLNNTAGGNIPELVLDKAKCSQMTEVQHCIVKHLESCPEPTPANVIGSMFQFIKKRTPCQQYEDLSTGKSSFTTSSAVLSFLVPLLAYGISKL